MKGLRARRRGRRAETPEENTERKPYESFIASRRLFFDAHHSNIQTQKAMLVSGFCTPCTQCWILVSYVLFVLVLIPQLDWPFTRGNSIQY